jgi:hypothetical protein
MLTRTDETMKPPGESFDLLAPVLSELTPVAEVLAVVRQQVIAPLT